MTHAYSARLVWGPPNTCTWVMIGQNSIWAVGCERLNWKYAVSGAPIRSARNASARRFESRLLTQQCEA